MNRGDLVEIKKGEVGTGLLIESDAGYISLDCGNNKELFESYKKLNEGMESGGDFHCPYPLIFNAVLQRYGVENANGRIYPETILKREAERYQTNIREKRAYSELNHPESSSIDLGRIAINVIEMHWEGNTLVGKIEVVTSPGFRKYGIISCEGDQTANLLLQGYKIGLSSRGLGSVTQRNGVLYVGDDFELVCFDVVSEPSTKNAWIAPYGEENPTENIYVSEQKENTNNPLFENLKKFDEWLND